MLPNYKIIFTFPLSVLCRRRHVLPISCQWSEPSIEWRCSFPRRSWPRRRPRQGQRSSRLSSRYLGVFPCACEDFIKDHTMLMVPVRGIELLLCRYGPTLWQDISQLFIIIIAQNNYYSFGTDWLASLRIFVIALLKEITLFKIALFILHLINSLVH